MHKGLYKKINGDLKIPPLNNLQRGFKNLKSTEISDFVCNDLLLLVHPFNPFHYISNNKNPDYERKRDDFISKYNGIMLFGFDELMMPISLQWLSKFGNKPNLIFYETASFSSEPLMPKVDHFTDSINLVFNPKKIILQGAELYLDKEGRLKPEGAINGTYRMLEPHFKVNIQNEYCGKE